MELRQISDDFLLLRMAFINKLKMEAMTDSEIILNVVLYIQQLKLPCFRIGPIKDYEV